MHREYLTHFRAPLTTAQRAALVARFPATRSSCRPQLIFLGARGPRAIREFARRLGLQARFVDL
jgi:hypothetical protein